MSLHVKIAGTVLMLLLLLGIASAFAEPGSKRGERAAQREAQSQQGQTPQDSEQSAQGGNSRDAAPEASGRRGGMTPEERRALRRQINEAGRDIYQSPRSADR